MKAMKPHLYRGWACHPYTRKVRVWHCTGGYGHGQHESSPEAALQQWKQEEEAARWRALQEDFAWRAMQ